MNQHKRHNFTPRRASGSPTREESPLNLKNKPIAAPVPPLMFSSTKRSYRNDSISSPTKSNHSYDEETEASRAKKIAYKKC
jgi:hypothetical protein